MVTVMLFGSASECENARRLIEEACDNKEQKAKQRAKEYEKKKDEKRRDRQLYHMRHTHDYEELELPLGASKVCTTCGRVVSLSSCVCQFAFSNCGLLLHEIMQRQYCHNKSRVFCFILPMLVAEVHKLTDAHAFHGTDLFFVSQQADVKKAFRQLAKKWHPDKHPDNQEEAKTKFQAIQKAFESLMSTDEDARIEALTAAANEAHMP